MTRIDNFRKALPENFGAVLILNASNRFYITGFRSSAGLAVITENEAFFYTDSRYIEMAKRTIKGFEVKESAKAAEEVAKLLLEKGIKSCMMENVITVAEAERYKKELKDIEVDLSSQLVNVILHCREIKDEQEIALIEKAQQIADDAFEATLKEMKQGMTEREVMLILEGSMRRLGAEDIAFDSIIVSGENGSLPHGVPGERRLQSGDMVTMDFGAKYGGYRCDITRTIAIGEISQEQRDIYDIVKAAQLAGVEALKPGVDCASIDKVSRDIITEKGFGEMFRHGLGHSLGIDIHEDPRLAPASKDTTKVGMVLTVEPGIYIPEKYGVRIEDSCVVTESGCRPLSRITKELITL